jgi:prepilin-type N-terminal cleavage/methylation domain-containing protein
MTMRTRQGFTLIELLVVIAIIAILMAILMPALNRVKEQGRTIKCLGGLKSWNLTFAMYVEDNDGRFPSGETAQGFWWITQMPDQYESYKRNPLWFCPTAKAPIRDEHGVTIPTFNIFNAWGIYTRADHGTINADGIAGSYGISGYVLSTPPGTTFEGGRRTDDNWRTPQVSGGNNIPLFVEALRFDLWPIATDPPAANEFAAWQGTNHMARCLINRHKGFVNTAFCDFSARKVGLKELYTLKWHKMYDTTGPWTKAGGAQSSDWPQWLRQFKDY